MIEENKTKEQSLEELIEIRKQMNEMAEAIPAILCLFTADNERVLYISPVYERIFGRDCDNLYKNPQSWLNYIHPEDLQRVINSDRTYHNKEHEIRYRIIRPDGSIKWLNDKVFPIRNEQNEIHRILRFIQDITEDMQIKETLRDAFQRSVDIVKAISSGLFIYQYEPEERFILIDSNPAAERMTGINIEEWRGNEINVILPQAKKVGLIDKCLNVIKTGETIEIGDMEYKDSRLEGNFRIRLFRMPGDQLG
ncbi:MAG: two-component system, sensor histidine kinase and response regulator, partial [Candidatus Poribacteria bacterium]|nr:two-component system, sensor histidine kinase and response regulator [Candidatus Poribacteria bacterium]